MGASQRASTPPVDPLAWCAIGDRVLDGALACDLIPEAEGIFARDSIARAEQLGASAEPQERRRLAITCVVIALGTVRDATRRPELACELGVSAAEVAHMRSLLGGYLAQRTQVSTTGNREADAALAQVVSLRDAMCGCTDRACVARVRARIDASSARLPADASDEARDLGGALIDDVQRCELRVDMRLDELLSP